MVHRVGSFDGVGRLAEMTTTIDWSDRADAAEAAVIGRHVRRVLGLPGATVGVVSWPPTVNHRLLLRWHLWWQAHLLDCAIDALERAGGPERLRRVGAIARGIRVRNGFRWTNAFYDDIAWLGLALQRAGTVAGCSGRSAVELIVSQLQAAFTRDGSGAFDGIPWQRGDVFRNTPANGPAAILLARAGHRTEAGMIADWIDRRLRLPGTDLIADGIRDDGAVEPTPYSYGQGVVLGAELELAKVGGERSRIHRLVAAVDSQLTTDGVLRGHGGGNGGLFTGILGRYLAMVALQLPGQDGPDRQCRGVAARLVLDSAAAAWDNATEEVGQPLFGADWTGVAHRPQHVRVGRPQHVRVGRTRRATVESVESPAEPARDLSVQLSGWMLTEAAATLASAN